MISAGRDPRNGDLMDLGLTGRTAVVTGGSKGIGLAVVTALAGSGARVLTGATTVSPALAELVSAGGGEPIEGDLAHPDGPARLVAAAGDQVDILVNNVGRAPARPGGFLSITDQDWLDTLNLDLLAAVRATRSALPSMLAAGGGGVVSVCSVDSRLPDPGVLDYSAPKAGLAAFSKALAKEVGPHGVRINTVSPGPVATDLWLGAGGVAQTVSAATGAQAADVASPGAGQSPTGRVTPPARGP